MGKVLYDCAGCEHAKPETVGRGDRARYTMRCWHPEAGFYRGRVLMAPTLTPQKWPYEAPAWCPRRKEGSGT